MAATSTHHRVRRTGSASGGPASGDDAASPPGRDVTCTGRPSTWGATLPGATPRPGSVELVLDLVDVGDVALAPARDHLLVALEGPDEVVGAGVVGGHVERATGVGSRGRRTGVQVAADVHGGVAGL